jgi:hypothetical protein
VISGQVADLAGHAYLGPQQRFPASSSGSQSSVIPARIQQLTK